MWTQNLILAPVIGLFALGLFVALQAGPVGLSPEGAGPRVIAKNATAVALRLAGFTAALLVLQRVLGAPSIVTILR